MTAVHTIVNDLLLPFCRLCEKFNVHTQPEKAEAFEKLTTQFLNSNLEKNYPKVMHYNHTCYTWFMTKCTFLHTILQSDAHYGAILLLLCLSDSPLHADFRPRPKEPPPQGDHQSEELSLTISGCSHYRYHVFQKWWTPLIGLATSWRGLSIPRTVTQGARSVSFLFRLYDGCECCFDLHTVVGGVRGGPRRGHVG